MERDNILAHGEHTTIIEHNFVLGTWKREGREHYETRIDVCSLCQCERYSVRNKHIPEGMFSGYWRSKIYYNHDTMPDCWGGPNP